MNGGAVSGLLTLNERDWQEFIRQIANPPKPNQALVALMRCKAPWSR